MPTLDAFVARVRTAPRERWNRDTFDFLVNNAGAALYKPIAETTEQEFDAIFNMHLKGVCFLTRKLLPALADGGRIINVSSGLTRVSMPGSSTCAIMKSGVEAFTRYLARELGPRGITANTVAPGAVQTDFGDGRTRDNPEVNRMISSMTALGRPGVAEDIGPMIASLLSDANRWTNGQRIEASGGMLV